MACGNETKFLSAEEARNCGRDNSVIFQEICSIQAAILAAVDNKKFEVVVKDGSPMTSVNEIVSVTVTNPGSGYSTFSATASVVHPNGTGALIDPIISGGTIIGFNITDGGTGYEPIEATANAAALGNFDAEVQLIISQGRIAQANIVLPGTNYLVGSAIPIIHPTGVNGVVTVASVDINGAITSLSIDNVGEGYETIVGSIDVDHPTGAGFSAIPVVENGIVNDVFVSNGGLGYGDLGPTVELVNPTGTGAIFDVTLDAGTISAITVVEGGAGYSDPTDIIINDAPSGTGINATALTTVDAGEYSSVDYYNVWMNNTTSAELSDQLDQVKKYFQKLGYNIRIEANTMTSNTIQWHIYW
jgi:hypothetical protein